MNIKIIDKNGVTLKTKGKYCKEDISVSVDESILGITPTGTYEVTNNGEYDITEYAKVNVNVAGSGSITGFADKTITEYSGNDTKVEASVFSNFTYLTKVNLPIATIIDEEAFKKCTALTIVNVPNVTSIGDSAFGECKALENINVQNLKTIGENSFNQCFDLDSIYLPQAISIGSYAFNYCKSLKVVIIGNETQVCVLKGANAFQNCYHLTATYDPVYNPDSTYYFRIYVPDSLVNDYKSATNWSEYAGIIKPLSELSQEYKDLYNIA